MESSQNDLYYRNKQLLSIFYFLKLGSEVSLGLWEIGRWKTMVDICFYINKNEYLEHAFHVDFFEVNDYDIHSLR